MGVGGGLAVFFWKRGPSYGTSTSLLPTCTPTTLACLETIKWPCEAELKVHSPLCLGMATHTVGVSRLDSATTVINRLGRPIQPHNITNQHMWWDMVSVLVLYACEFLSLTTKAPNLCPGQGSSRSPSLRSLGPGQPESA